MKSAAAACAASCMLLASCTSSLFQSKVAAPTTYLLSANLAASADSPDAAEGAASAAAMASVAADLAVQRPRVRTGLDTDRIAVLYSDRRLDSYADARWSGPLDQVVQDLIVQAFGSAARLRNVSAEASAFPSGYWLEVLVTDFQAEYAAAAAPIIHVRLLARLGAAGDRHVLRTFDADSRRPAADNRMTAIVDAYERAADAALKEIVAGTSQALAENLEHR